MPLARLSLATAVLCAGLLAVATAASADRLVAGGNTIAGDVKAVTPKGVEFQPAFAKDPMLVPWENVEDLSSEGSFQVLYGEEQEANAPISGFKDGKIQLGEVAVAPEELVSVAATAGGAPGWGENIRSTFRYWHGSFDLGFNLQQATNDNLGLMVGFNTLRAKGPTRLLLGASYRYANNNPQDDNDGVNDKENTQDAAAAGVRGEYDITKRLFAYVSTDVLYDAVQDLNLRAVPKAGLGFVVWQREPKEGVRDFLQVEAGGGWVYENYMDYTEGPADDCDGDGILGERCSGDEDDYFTVALGAAAAVLLPYGAAFDWRFDYLPSVSDFTGDYVIRTQAGLSVPLFAPVSARMGIVDTYDSSPSPGADKNSLVFDTGLSLVW